MQPIAVGNATSKPIGRPTNVDVYYKVQDLKLWDKLRL